MEKIDPCKVIESLLHIREIVQKVTSQSREEISYREDEFNDLSHLLEFGKLNAVELTQAAKQLIESRKVRRDAKNQNELLSPLCEYINKNTAFFNGLESINIDIQKMKRTQTARSYKVRVREDLKDKLENAQ